MKKILVFLLCLVSITQLYSQRLESNRNAIQISFKREAGCETACYVQNNTQKEVSGTMKTLFTKFDHSSISHSEMNVILKPGLNRFDIAFPQATGYIQASTTLNVPEKKFTKVWHLSIGIDSIVYHPTKPLVNDMVESKFKSLPWNQQVVHGWLGERMTKNTVERLENVDVQSLIGSYQNQPGIHPWIGEHAGKFLDAACNSYNYQPNAQLKLLMDKIAQNLIASQQEDGYLGTYSNKDKWTSWDVWSHKYNLVGLINYYETSGYIPALNACKRMGNLLCKTFGTEAGKKDIIKAGEHVGMAATSVLEPMVDLYKLTGDTKYLNFCKYILQAYNEPNGPKILNTLRETNGKVNKVANGKAYEMLSNFYGIVKLYKVTGDTDLISLMQLAWNDIVKNRMYITGTASYYEHFHDDNDLPATRNVNMGEGCVTTTWLQFNYQMFTVTGDIKYIDEMERSTYNHLIGAENPETGCVSYYTPLLGVKPFSCDITCCMSSVPRGISMIPLFTDGLMGNNPAFLLYQAGEANMNVNGQNIKFITDTRFPEDGNVKITVQMKKTSNFTLLLRNPYWAKAFTVHVNGKEINTQENTNNNTLVKINRKWSNNDRIQITFDLPLVQINGGKSYPESIAVQRGPQVLAEDNNITNSLPQYWVGTQIYPYSITVNGKTENITLVPYADAGQTGGEVTTWIKTKD